MVAARDGRLTGAFAIRGGLPLLLVLAASCGDGLRDVRQYEAGQAGPRMVAVEDTRAPVPVDDPAAREHRDVMLQHLQTMDQIVGALAEGNFMLARMQAEAHASFFARRMQTVKRFEDYPSSFQELALQHQTATEALAASIPSKDFPEILSKLDGVLKVCTACHRAFMLRPLPK